MSLLFSLTSNEFFFSFYDLSADTIEERNRLMRDVYPSLRTYCQQRGLEFQVVDMRWGVRDEATADHKTNELCVQEIKNCQRLTPGPNFIVRNSKSVVLFLTKSLNVIK